MHTEDLRDRYPEVERPFRSNGSPESVAKCLEPVLENIDEIVGLINRVCSLKNIQAGDVFLFQSRAMGTCKPSSDIDIYVRLDERHRSFVEEHGVSYKNTGVKLIVGEWAAKYLSDLPSEVLKLLAELRVDLFFGVDDKPPAKDEYRGRRYYINFKELCKGWTL